LTLAQLILVFKVFETERYQFSLFSNQTKTRFWSAAKKFKQTDLWQYYREVGRSQ